MKWYKNRGPKIVGAVLVVLAITYGIYLIFLSTPKIPNEDATVQQRVEFMASSGFKRLPEEVQREYLSKNRSRRGSGERPVLTESQRQKLRENTRELREKMMKERLLAYFAKTPEERRAFVKEWQKRMEERRKAREQNRSTNQNSSTDTNRNSRRTEWRNRPPEQRVKMRLDHSSPETRALRSAMRKDMRRAR